LWRIVVDHRKNEMQGRAKPEAIRPLDPLLGLPCVDSTLHSSYFEGLRGARGVDLLRIALPSTLLFRAQSDNPDAIVIVTEESFPEAWGNDSSLEEIFSDTPTVLLARTLSAAITRSASRLNTLGTSVGHNYSSACCRDCSDGSWLRCYPATALFAGWRRDSGDSLRAEQPRTSVSSRTSNSKRSGSLTSRCSWTGKQGGSCAAQRLGTHCEVP
jgi:hypothetical protein